LRIGRSDYRIEIDNGPKQNYVKPAADPLFQSAADAFGPAALAVVLTGMGRDAFRGAAAIKSAGGTVLVQDPADSVAKGMPGTVVDAGLADEILPLRRIGPAIAQRIAQLHPRPRPVPAPVRRRTTRSATA
jgi:two-component system chemotaxis response regulator CheB